MFLPVIAGYAEVFILSSAVFQFQMPADLAVVSIEKEACNGKRQGDDTVSLSSVTSQDLKLSATNIFVSVFFLLTSELWMEVSARALLIEALRGYL
jgi:hypothetical protein